MAQTAFTEPVSWDPYVHAQQVAPYEIWRRLRDEAPVYHSEKYGFYALSRFDDVLSASLDTDTFSSARGITIDTIPDPPPIPMMIMMDPPHHDVLRKVVSRAYTPRRVNALEARIRELCEDYLGPFVGTGGMDYVRDFGMRLPVMVISTLLGFPGSGSRSAPRVERSHAAPRRGPREADGSRARRSSSSSTRTTSRSSNSERATRRTT